MRRGPDENREHLSFDVNDVLSRSDEDLRRSWNPKSEFNHWPHIFNLTNCIIGVSVLAMPYCLQQCGILLGTVLIGLCSCLTKLTCHVLYKGAVTRRARSYPAFARETLGSSGQRLVEVLMLLYLMSSCISFMVVIGDVGPQALAEYLQLQAPTQRLRVLVMVFTLLFIILPLSTVRNLDSLSIISYVTVMFYCIFVIRMLIESIPRLFDGKWALDVYWWRQEGILTSLPIIAMALSCQTQLFDIADCIKDSGSRKIDTIVSGAVNICSGIYAAVGLFGYVAFHDIALHGDILLYLQSTVLTQFLKLGFMLSIAVSVPLMLFPCRTTCYNFFRRDSEYSVAPMPSSAFLGITITLLFLTFFVAIFVPNVEFVLGLTGSVIGSTVTIIIPSFLFIQVCDSSRRNKWLLRGAKPSPSLQPSKLQPERCLSIGCLMLYRILITNIQQNRKPFAYERFKLTALAGMFMLICSTWAVLQTEQERTVVDVIQPKRSVSVDSESDYLKAAGSAELFKADAAERSNDSIQVLPAETFKELPRDRKENELGDAKRLLAEIRKQQKEQGKILKEQRAIVQQLNKHHEMHKNAEKEKNNKQSTNSKVEAQDGGQRKLFKKQETKRELEDPIAQKNKNSSYFQKDDDAVKDEKQIDRLEENIAQLTIGHGNPATNRSRKQQQNMASAMEMRNLRTEQGVMQNGLYESTKQTNKQLSLLQKNES